MTRYHAAWILPITGPPIRDGWVDVEDGLVTGVGSGEDRKPPSSSEVTLGSSLVLPGLVNAHTHLELSGLHGRVPPADSMPSWARDVLARTADGDPDLAAIDAAAALAYRSGTALVGDISNTLESVDPLRRSPMDGVVFKEVLGFNERSPNELLRRTLAELDRHQGEGPRLSLAAHAPYSVSPALFFALREAADTHAIGPLSVHVAESVAELEFLRSGTGPWREILEERGRWDDAWAPADDGPIAYLDRLGWVRGDTLMVHGVQLTAGELDRLAAAGTTLVACPRSNRWTGAGTPPMDRFYASGVRVALGTDSLASAADLNLFAEVHEVRRLAPQVPASEVLRSATLYGAEALGFGGRFGAIEVGYQAALIAVSGATAADDVEEYLVGGIQPGQVTWLVPRDDGS